VQIKQAAAVALRDFLPPSLYAGDKRFAAEIKLILVDTLKRVGH
jgi:hypothetical protein